MIPVLSIDYIPKRIPHREKYVKTLTSLHSAVLVGPIGVGKTLTLFKAFSRNLLRATAYIYRTKYSLLRELVSRIVGVPRRGVRFEDLLSLLIDTSMERGLVVAIDDADYLIKRGFELSDPAESLFESLVKSDVRVFIVIHSRYYLQYIPISNIVEYHGYTHSELEEILYSRVEEAEDLIQQHEDEVLKWFLRNINDDVIILTSRIVGCDTGGSGDCRLALEILNRACMYAYAEGRGLGEEHVRRAYLDTLDPETLRTYYESHIL